MRGSSLFSWSALTWSARAWPRLTCSALTCLALTGCGGTPVEQVASTAQLADDLPVTPETDAADWPWWRGTERNNTASGDLAPIKWSKTDNIAWKAEIPGRGHASPCLWGNRIFLSSADETAKTKFVLCLNRETGEQLWKTTVHDGGFLHVHHKNSQASATPVCDGTNVYVPFLVKKDGQDGLWVTALDLDGKIVWQESAGPFSSKHGYGSSPAIYKSLLIIAGDNGGSGFLTALDRETGSVHWRV
ncbi:MAG: PQQ-binding-like beta-propeller repeat protein, partial [Planctomycetales bacterium]